METNRRHVVISGSPRFHRMPSAKRRAISRAYEDDLRRGEKADVYTRRYAELLVGISVLSDAEWPADDPEWALDVEDPGVFHPIERTLHDVSLFADDFE